MTELPAPHGPRRPCANPRPGFTPERPPCSGAREASSVRVRVPAARCRGAAGVRPQPRRDGEFRAGRESPVEESHGKRTRGRGADPWVHRQRGDHLGGPSHKGSGQVMKWLRRKHRRITWKELRPRCCGGGWWPTAGRWAGARWGRRRNRPFRMIVGQWGWR
ncbi:hypothetical protein FF041_29425 [Streptomyces jumonjinensis]|uniref:Uncharacterized protein n=1 Tax=Streptomyces jumonjinensis TaxID=1945 RepID=A0A646KP97_STRJU|nr:hypothetical protein [Streptomyces jumonjinensis]